MKVPPQEDALTEPQKKGLEHMFFWVDLMDVTLWPSVDPSVLDRSIVGTLGAMRNRS